MQYTEGRLKGASADDTVGWMISKSQDQVSICLTNQLLSHKKKKELCECFFAIFPQFIPPSTVLKVISNTYKFGCEHAPKGVRDDTEFDRIPHTTDKALLFLWKWIDVAITRDFAIPSTDFSDLIAFISSLERIIGNPFSKLIYPQSTTTQETNLSCS